jgi:aspartate/methionine/tyrosine aminotransferase
MSEDAKGRSAVHFSDRVDVSAPNPIIALQRKMKAEGIALRQLNDSNPTHHGLGLTADYIPQRYDALPRGPIEARRLLADFLTKRADNDGFDVPTDLSALSSDAYPYLPDGSEKPALAHNQTAVGKQIDPEDLYLASSTSEAYSWIMKLMCDPGEAVLCPTPGYPLIASIARLEGIEAVTYPQRFDGSWTIDVPRIAQLLAASRDGSLDPVTGEKVPPIRLLTLISPNNPTGAYVGADDYGRLIGLCQQYGLPILVDEVFFDFPLHPLHTPFRVAGEERVLTFALDGFSKLLAAPHSKVGWIQMSGPADDMDQAKKRLDVIADDFLPMSSIISSHFEEMFARVTEQVKHLRERTQNNLATLERLLGQSSGVASLLRPEGGWNVLVRFPGALDEADLIDTMIREHHLSGQPGFFFDMPDNGYVCVSLLPQADEFEDNVRLLLRTIDAKLD